jgi:AcrR family transcriptional regulator
MRDASTEWGYVDIKSQLIQNATKIKILDTAIDFFSRKGYSGVSVRDITKEVGIKESSLYKHFKSKEEILETIFFNFRKEVAHICPPVHQLEKIVSIMSPKAFLERGVLNFKEHIENATMRKIWRIVFIEQYRDPLARDIYLNDILGSTVAFLEKAFGIMISKNLIKPHNPKTLAVEYQYPIFTMVAEYLMLKFENGDVSEAERKMSDHIEFFCSIMIP